MPSPNASLGRVVVTNAAIAVAYAAVGMVALRLARDTGLAAPIWPSAGLAFAAALVLGARGIPGVAAGSALVNLPTLLSARSATATGVGAAIAVSAAIAVGAALQAQLGASGVRRFVGRSPTLMTGRPILLFLLLAGPVACLVNPTIGLVAQLSGNVVAPAQAASVWLTWWVGDAIGVIVFGPITLMLVPAQSAIWSGRRWQIAIPSLVITTVIGVVFIQTATLAQRQVQFLLEQRASEAVEAVRQDQSRGHEALLALRSLYDSSEYVSRSEFDAFTTDTRARIGGLRALSWNPVVPADDLRTFQRQQLADEGQAGFQVFQRGPDGMPEPVPPRPEYVPVTYIEPRAPNQAVLGFDLASDPVPSAALRRARDSGQSVATPPTHDAPDTGNGIAVLELLPVYDDGVPGSVEERRARLAGYVMGMVNPSAMLAESLGDPEWDGYHVELTDVTDADDPLLLATRQPTAAETEVDPILAPAVHDDRTFEVGGRTWALRLQPTAEVYAALGGTPLPAVLLAGMLVSGLLEAFLLLLTGTERRAQQRADVSGHDAVHDPLTDLVNRRGFISQLEAARQRARAPGTPSVLMFLDLDGFKQVNDVAGHLAGDRLLVEISTIMRAQIRSRDTVARMGGDEFAILLDGCPLERGERVAADLVTAVAGHRTTWEGREFGVGASIGVVPVVGPQPRSSDDLLQSADRACYEAKAAGRGRVRTRIDV